MKRIVFTSIATSVIVCLSVSPIFAQESSPPGNFKPLPKYANDRQEIVASKAMERKEFIDDRVASRAANLDARKQMIVTRIISIGNLIIKEANMILGRLDNIWTRVASRIDKIKSTGKDVSSLDPGITNVQSKRDAAVAAIASTSASLSTLQGSNEPKAAAETLKQNVKTMHMALRAYQESIINVIKSIKAMSPMVSDRPTATGSAIITIVPTISTQ